MPGNVVLNGTQFRYLLIAEGIINAQIEIEFCTDDITGDQETVVHLNDLN